MFTYPYILIILMFINTNFHYIKIPSRLPKELFDKELFCTTWMFYTDREMLIMSKKLI
jgi:hypothetical protein